MDRRFEPKDPDFEVRVRDSFDRQGVMHLIGAELTLVEPGLVQIELPFRDDLTQQHGFFHAGITSTIADSAGGYAGFTLFPGGSSVLTVEYKMNLLAPADGERLIATGRVVKPGRTLTVCQLDVETLKDGKLTPCAHGLQTLICLHGRSDAARPSSPR
ncbi:MAG TPA: PaaI family thioesterase [Alphaproteobacteria bacterium]|nr:PaaI family thioesterase [Alphaproteobacteria bacterium]